MDARTTSPFRRGPAAVLAALTPLERLAFALYGLVLAAVCLLSLLWPTVHTVYPIYALAAQHWRAGEDMYGVDAVWDRFRYSPTVAVTVLPYQALPLGWGGAAWKLTCGAVLLAGLAVWFRWLLAATAPAGEGLTTRRRRFAVLLLLALPLVVTNLRNAQANTLVLGLMLLALAAAARSRWGWSAAASAAAILLKIYPAALALLLVLVYPRRFALRLAAALAAGLAAPFLFQDPHYVAGQYASWAHQSGHDARQAERAGYAYRNVLMLMPDQGQAVSVRGYQVLQLAVAGVIAGVCLAARRRRWPPERLLPLMLGLVSCWMTGFGPASEGPTYVLLAATAAWAVVDSFRRPGAWASRAVGLAGYGLLLAGFVSGGWPALREWTMRAHPAAAVLLLAYGVVTAVAVLVREPAPSGESSVPTAAEGPANAARAA